MTLKHVNILEKGEKESLLSTNNMQGTLHTFSESSQGSCDFNIKGRLKLRDTQVVSDEAEI